MLSLGVVPRKPRSERPKPVVRRSGSGGRRQLSPEVEALARGETDRLSTRRRRPKLDDPRAVALVPGVANRDARLAGSSRLRRMQQLVEQWRGSAAGDEAHEEAERRLGLMLAETVRLGLWRALAVASFDALVEELLDLPAEQARALARRAAERHGISLVRASEETIAVWLRTEASLLQLGCERARVRCVGEGEDEELHIALPLERAPVCLKEIGWKVAPLAGEEGRRPTPPGGQRRVTPPMGTRRPVVVDAPSRVGGASASPPRDVEPGD